MKYHFLFLLILCIPVLCWAAHELGSDATAAATDNVGADNTIAMKYTFTGSTGDVLDSIVVYGYISGGGTETLTASLYDDNAGSPGTRLVTANASASGASAAWHYIDMGASQTLTNGVEYWVAVASNGGNWIAYYEGSAGAVMHYRFLNNPATWGTSDGSNDSRYTQYGVNIPGAGEEAPTRRRQLLIGGR